MSMDYEFCILQDGSLPLAPRGGPSRPPVEHRCTATLVWPAGVTPQADNCVIVDPSFTPAGLQEAQARLAALGLDRHCLRTMHVTHPHGDHQPGWQVEWPGALAPFTPGRCAALDGLRLVPLPGHHARLQALVFPTATGPAWAAGDAVLDAEWLTAWGYYWPNRYDEAQVADTWRSVATIVAGAAVIIPGHGAPITVDRALVRLLLRGFPDAEEHDACPEVAVLLQRRLGEL
jgi:glyoxylase-like metal-dependent hydrolase (beta-lactamase superfamily II)